MKKLLLSIALFSAVTTAFAQSASFGIKGGVNFADVAASSGSFSATLGSLTTFSVGAFTDIKAGAISVQPGIYYTGKGFKTVTTSTESVSLDLKYVEVPVNFVYHVPAVVGDVYFGAGPYAAIGVNGKAKAKSGSDSYEEDVTFGDGPEDIKKTDFGLQFIGGFHFSKGLLIGVNYDLGLSDISNDDSTDGTLKHRVWGISVGFTF
ncbi:porin family protein [Mucilaginibacter segetis]|uniref:PorT family protein n=1 Tax=Mucilaginibacter segetis TaxID=2793071 RepID=A0A934PWC3_9SPHI|nr:porin family protein [Mucilaginibacter segetis]MBK0380877.1 PorT family protein [Mucilaginibacter segetis]